MARPSKFKNPKKLNLYVEETTVERARRVAIRLNKSISDVFSDFIAKHSLGDK
jgi:hypothetical protein|tara:strand:- start:11992 stop:12150 length:159 start_codon:yes stop_codon:yes gene_type:complete